MPNEMTFVSDAITSELRYPLLTRNDKNFVDGATVEKKGATALQEAFLTGATSRHHDLTPNR
jgi:hypothetical protein